MRRMLETDQRSTSSASPAAPAKDHSTPHYYTHQENCYQKARPSRYTISPDSHYSASQDIEHDLTPAIRMFKQKIREADTILFASPEHNYSITAVMKNAIAWGNRPPGDRSWKGKPAGIISASSGPRGGGRSQIHLRQRMVDREMYPIKSP